MSDDIDKLRAKVALVREQGAHAGVSDVSDDLDKLRAKVALMRELGINEADGIKLGAPVLPPKPAQTKEEWDAAQIKLEERHHAVMFAASATRPRMKLVKKP